MVRDAKKVEKHCTRGRKQVNPLAGLGAVLCKQAKTVKSLLAYTRKPREPSLAGILRYLYRRCQLMLGFKVASSKSNPI